VSKTIGYRLFGRGRLPDALRGDLDGENILFHTEGVRVRASGSYRVPGRAQLAGVRLHSGAFVITSRRVVASIGTAKVADVPFLPRQPAGAASITLASDGLHLHFDVAHSTPNGSGTSEIFFREGLPAALLAGLPSLELAVSPSASGVEALLRWV